MDSKKFEEIYKKYIKEYPHLAGIKYGNWKKIFAQNALMLRAPENVTAQDVYELSKMCG